MLENTSLRKKLWLPPIVGGVALLALFIVTLWLGWHVDAQLEELEFGHYPSVSFSKDLQDILVRVQLELRDAVAMEDRDEVHATNTLRDSFLARIENEKENPILEPEELDALAALFEAYHASAVSASLEMLSGADLDEGFTEHLEALRERYVSLKDQLEARQIAAEEQMLGVLEAVRVSQARVARAHGLVSIICVAILALVSHGMVSDITSLIERLRASAAKVAAGDLREQDLVFDEREQTRQDELGDLVRSFSAMRFNLRILVAGAGSAASSVRSGARGLDKFHRELALVASAQDATMVEIDSAVAGISKSINTIGTTMEVVSVVAVENSHAAESLEDVANEVATSLDSQVEAVDQVAASTAEMGISTKKIAENAQFLNRSATEVATAVEELGRATDAVSQRAADTAQVANEFNERSKLGQQKAIAVGSNAAKVQQASSQLVGLMDTLGTRLQVVGQINSVIQEIVDETTLLSLNARIVSAQAGTQGKSFAVVAEAIKDLAARAGKSTDEIRNALTSIQEDAGLAATAVEVNAAAVEDGATQAKELASELDRIGEGATRCLDNMSEISAACAQQSQGLSEVRSAVRHVSGIADQVEIGTTEQASASERVHHAVKEMMGFIEQIRQAAANQRMGTVGIAAGATNLAQQVEEVARTLDETKRSGEDIRGGLESFADIRDQSRKAAEVVGDEVTELVDKTKKLSAEIKSFRL